MSKLFSPSCCFEFIVLFSVVVYDAFYFNYFSVFYIYSRNSSVYSAGKFVSDRPHALGNLIGRFAVIFFVPENYYLVVFFYVRDLGNIDNELIHTDSADDRGSRSVYRHEGVV